MCVMYVCTMHFCCGLCFLFSLKSPSHESFDVDCQNPLKIAPIKFGDQGVSAGNDLHDR